MATIKTRVSAVALAPIIALIGFAAIFTEARWTRYQAGAHLQYETGLAVAAGELVHRLQIERGRTTWHLRAGETATPDIRAARAAVDEAAHAFRARRGLERRPAANANDAPTEAFEQAIARIPALRGDADGKAVNAQAAFARYTAMIDAGLHIIANVQRGTASLSSQIGRELQIYDALATGKEYAGQERAMGAVALTAPATIASEAARVAALQGAETGAFAPITRLSDGRFAQQWAAFEASDASVHVMQLRTSLFDHIGTAPAVTPSQWFDAYTTMIDGIHVLESEVAGRLITLAAADMHEALSDLLLALAASVGATIGAIAVARSVARSITVPLEKLTAATSDLATGNLEAAIDVETGPREITDLSGALRVFRDGLRANQTLTRELAEANRVTSLGVLVAGIAHEVNTPIGNALIVASSITNGTTSFAREIEGGTVRRSAIAHYLETAQEAGRLLMLNLERASQQIRSFKQIAVDQASNRRRTFDVKRAVEDAVRSCTPLIREAGVRIDLQLEDGLELDSFPGGFSQVIVNLVENAIKHGLVGIKDATVTIEARRFNASFIRLVVSDNGVGIPGELGEKVFSAFFTTQANAGGSGLGLHIVKTVVTGQLGGHIALENNNGGGARFVVLVPLNAPAETAASPPDDRPALTAAA